MEQKQTKKNLDVTLDGSFKFCSMSFTKRMPSGKKVSVSILLVFFPKISITQPHHHIMSDFKLCMVSVYLRQSLKDNFITLIIFEF